MKNKINQGTGIVSDGEFINYLLLWANTPKI